MRDDPTTDDRPTNPPDPIDPIDPAQPSATRIAGTITRLVLDKGFFFIAASGGDYFAHRSDLQNCPIDRIVAGDKATFEPSSSPKGLRATAIMVETRR